MSSNQQYSASIRILELNLADALEQAFKTRSLPVKITATKPRPGGLCEKVIDAICKRAVHSDAVDREELYAHNTLTLFASDGKKIVLDSSVSGRDVFVVLDFPLPDPKKVTAEAYLASRIMGTDVYISLAQEIGDAAKLNGAAHVHLIMPSYAYARQDKNHGERAPIGAKIIAQNLEPYYDSVTSVHLHSPAIKGMFRSIPLNEISPNEIYAPSFVCRSADDFTSIAPEALTLSGVNAMFSQLCLVSPDAGGAKHARDFAKYCKTFAAVQLDVDESKIVDIPMAQIDKRRPNANESEVMNVLGRENVKGRKAIIIDDMGDTFGTATLAADAVIEAGATSVEFWGAHGYFSGPALKRVDESKISRVNITNSMALRSEVLENPEIKVLDIAPVLAQVIIDLTTAPETNLHIQARHLDQSDRHRQTLGRHVFAMMPTQ